MTSFLAEAGYEVIGVDLSEDMLSEAAGKTVSPGKIPPILPSAEYGGAGPLRNGGGGGVCLDSINYLTDARALKRALQRLHLFVAPRRRLSF